MAFTGLSAATGQRDTVGSMKLLARPLSILCLALSLCLMTSTAVAQDAGPVSIEVEIYLVNQVTRDDGSREERLTPTTEARPGQTIEYRLIARNVGDETLPASIVVVTGPVPSGTQFVPNSATPSTDALLTEYSADGGQNYFETNVFIGEGAQRTIAEPTAYTTVRWTLLDDMEPDDELVLVYRVIVR